MRKTKKKNTAIIRQSLDDKSAVISLFRTVINQSAGYRQALQVIAERPEVALTMLQDAQYELSSQGAAKILEEVISGMDNDVQAAKFVKDHLSEARQIELLSARSDLDSVAASIADLNVVIEAIRKDLRDDATMEQARSHTDSDGEIDRTKVLRAAYICRSWARKLVHRQDYGEILDSTVVDGFTFLECLLIVLSNEVLNDQEQRDEEGDDESELPMDQSYFGTLSQEEDLISVEAFEAVGIEPERGMDLLRELLESKRLLRYKSRELQAAKAEREEKRKAQEATAEAARDTAADAAGKIDF